MKDSRLLQFIGFCLLLILAFSGCGPVKGYPGPELPDSQLAIVTYSGATIKDVSVNGASIYTRGISLLPGRHVVDTTRLVRNPYDCFSRQDFDSYGYDYCMDEREEDIRKGKTPTTCLTSTYTQTKTNCRIDNIQHYCHLEVDLAANETYQVVDFNRADGPMTLTSSRNMSIAIPCRFDRRFDTREDL